MQYPQSFMNQNLLANISTFNILSNSIPTYLPMNMPSMPLPFNNSYLDLYNTMLMWKLQSAAQSEQLIKAQSLEANTHHLLQQTKQAKFTDDIEQTSTPTSPNKELLVSLALCDPNKSIKAHLKDIIYFILNHFGTSNEEMLKIERLKYRNNKELLLIFDALIAKYSSSVKTREEMIKYVFRKGLKFMKQNLKAGRGKKGAQEPISSQKRQFKTFIEEICCKIEKEGGRLEDDDDEEDVESPPQKKSGVSPK